MHQDKAAIIQDFRIHDTDTGSTDVQIALLTRHRHGDTDPSVLRGVHLSINGIAAGLRNSG